ncbi:uroporphyrinogen decarboxylase isoform X1 [Neodiprion virginianus]|uniref:Uroporphyrinogen decarboxylase n=3 Tax=Neodiprion TaxID=270857 RepID=A0A6J0C9R2_NEOLC|nr:uroporphyrinogen decarboxylase isoform X1 [Neodiprion lecontei]XP_046430916.1 uroporphyrinogen decarboxylase isoform X1 [Neodiprion fabricii]XP_046486802.1 uroporphyrinogen decarboxylase isoform X1 [Neodiprion pinetum]XP_046624033.1 uroporphyrinogen decarboxylase isoform X1 [Neodiprion virginianus]
MYDNFCPCTIILRRWHDRMTEHNFPPLKNDRLLRAVRGEPVDKVPVWIMRQAGRHLPEFREIRLKHDFFTICRTPALACEVTLQPIRRFDYDASIIFSDILVIPQAMGMEVEMKAGVGPVLPEPLTDPSHLLRLITPDVEKTLGYVGDAITLTRQCLQGKVPLIGFTGAPWTLMGYMVQGGGSSTMAQARFWLYHYPEASHQLLQQITNVVIDYLVMQVKSGAQLLQVFESSGDFLNDELFQKFSLKYLKQINEGVKKKLDELNIPQVPMTAFPKGATLNSLEMLVKESGYDVIGLDWTVDPAEARARLGPNVTLQGNMDPCALYASEAEVFQRAANMVKTFGKERYIANLGHGILPDAPIASVEAFITGVHSV